MYNLHIRIDAEDKNDRPSRLRLDYAPAGTQLLCQHNFGRYYYKIMLKSSGLNVVSSPSNVLRDKLGRLIL